MCPDELFLLLIGHYGRGKNTRKLDQFFKKTVFSPHALTNICLIRNDLFLRRRAKKLKKAGRKERNKVLLLCPDIDVFVLEDLFWLFKSSSKFDPVIGIPLYDHLDDSVGVIKDKKRHAEEYFAENKISYYVFGESKEKIKEDLKKISPDIVIYNCTLALQSISDIFQETRRAVSINVPYGYYLTNLQHAQFDNILVNQMDYLFWESPITVQMSKAHARNKGINSYFAGYPKLDGILFNKTYSNPWKKQSTVKKRIIWAPHHSIEDDAEHYGFSCFLILADFMLETARKYSEIIQVAFKPHPILKTKLYNHGEWGGEKTDKYYSMWEEMENGQLAEGDYKGLFLESDAMILDSISFMCEYTAIGRPALFTVRDNTISHKFNEFGEKVFKQAVYKSGNDTKKSITNFIEKVVLSGDDVMHSERAKLAREELYIPGNKSACENILEFICRELQIS